jgi:hypothetical protein
MRRRVERQVPREDACVAASVRNALVYVLANVKKHVRGARGMDPRSSARWFEGCRRAIADPEKPSPVAKAQTWLARVGWRRHGLIDVEEAPRTG